MGDISKDAEHGEKNKRVNRSSLSETRTVEDEYSPHGIEMTEMSSVRKNLENDDGRPPSEIDGDGSEKGTEVIETYMLYTPDEEASVIRAFDRRLVLFIAVLYMLSFLDRSSMLYLQGLIGC
jgi:hypothetical protein